jgi:hypothetical protein
LDHNREFDGIPSEPPRFVTAGPVTIFFLIVAPDEQQSFVLEFTYDLFKSYKWKLFSDGRHLTPQNSKVRELETAVCVGDAINPRILGLCPLRRGRNFVGSPHSIEVENPLRHQQPPG